MLHGVVMGSSDGFWVEFQRCPFYIIYKPSLIMTMSESVAGKERYSS